MVVVLSNIAIEALLLGAQADAVWHTIIWLLGSASISAKYERIRNKQQMNTSKYELTTDFLQLFGCLAAPILSNIADLIFVFAFCVFPYVFPCVSLKEPARD